MSLTTVTITGADDQVDPVELMRLSAVFPFVEWGILCSEKRRGTPRYPSLDWILDLCVRVREVRATVPVRLSAHFCGQHTRDTCAGDTFWLRGLQNFVRVQLNGFSRTAELVSLIDEFPDLEFILQARDPYTLGAAVAIAEDCFTSAARVTALWDVSGGRGVSPECWPTAPQIGEECIQIPLGFAGGITPDNVLDVLGAIGPRDEDFWIDMESGVRTDDEFDLAKVRQVLAKVHPLMRKP